jgi:hypothetical protein
MLDYKFGMGVNVAEDGEGMIIKYESKNLVLQS